MADIITLANAETVTGTGGASTKQAITEAIDVSGYDSIDFQFTCLAVNNANGINVTILTSMQNKSDDSSWVSIGQSSALSNTPSWASLTVPASTSTPMLRYIRYQIDFGVSVTSATVSISGMARRKSA